MEAAPPDHGNQGLDGDEGIPRALALAHRYLNRRERTVAEMRGHLEGRDCDGDEVERVIELLSEQGYLDDARYARLFTEDKRTLEQWGSERIRRGLLSRGVERELIELALAETDSAEAPLAGSADPLPAGFAGDRPTGFADPPLAGADQARPRDGELTRALAVLARRFTGPPTDARERERMLGVLLRKGYESELALEALDVFADCAEGPSVLRCP